MGAHSLSHTAAMQRQRLMLEFNGLRTASPQGVFLSLSPKDPALWTGVIFVRDGPYAGAILRFNIRFPSLYPAVPPLITFTTDIFHPLLAPLTVSSNFYTSPEDGSTGIIILDDERLPPGGFSLRHGFPAWFRRSRSQMSDTQRSSGVQGKEASPGTPTKSPGGNAGSIQSPASAANSSPGSTASRDMAAMEAVTIYEILRYIRSSFDDALVLDKIPLEAAGNSGAWHAWRAHRALKPQAAKGRADVSMEGQSRKADGPLLKTPFARVARQPGEWNWEGVWQVRAKKGIDLSISEASLYGNSTSNDELINFLPPDREALEAARETMKQSLKTA